MELYRYLEERLPRGKYVILLVALFSFIIGSLVQSLNLFQRLSKDATSSAVTILNAPTTPHLFVSIVLNIGTGSENKGNGPLDSIDSPAPEPRETTRTLPPAFVESKAETPVTHRPTLRPPVEWSPRDVESPAEPSFNESTDSPESSEPINVRIVPGLKQFRTYGQLWEDLLLTFTPEDGSSLPPVKITLTRWSDGHAKLVLPQSGLYRVSMTSVSEIWRLGPSVKVRGGGSAKVMIREGFRIRLSRDFSGGLTNYDIAAKMEPGGTERLAVR